jgi:hypothetical protein
MLVSSHRVDDPERCGARHPAQFLRVAGGPDHENVEVPGEDAGGIADRLGGADLQVVRTVRDDMRAETHRSDRERRARARRGLREVQPDRSACERRRRNAGGVGKHGGAVDDFVESVGVQIGDRQQAARHRAQDSPVKAQSKDSRCTETTEQCPPGVDARRSLS